MTQHELDGYSIDQTPSVDLVITTPQGEFVVRRMRRPEVDRAIDWAAAEGWNPGLNDAECFFATDPRGFFIGELNGQMIGSAFAVTYDEHYAFFGGYIVQPEFRHQGFGMQITRTWLAYVGDRNVGLDGVVSMESKYAMLGFRLAHRSIRYGGTAHGEGTIGFTEIVELAQVPFEELAAYDRLHFSAPRPAFLRSWISQPGATALGAVEGGRLVGYGVVRPCRVGYKIGPLFADRESIAEDLFQSLSAVTAGQSIFLDVPEPHPRAMALAERHGMKPVFEVARMYRRTAPSVPMTHVFGVTTFELG
jgi:GNAT superfamily N-acetyltransferase